MSLIDGYIGTFEAKYHYKFWRPVTAIRLANTDGNPAHRGRSDLDAARGDAADPGPRLRPRGRGRGGRGGPAALLPHRPGALLDLQHDAAGREQLRRRRRRVRHYRSFSQAAEENGESRILVGFHFRHAVDDGIEHGGKIGDRAVARFMQPRR